MLNREPLIGVLGGLGPMATSWFSRRVIELTDADADQEHANLLILNHAAVPDRTAYLLGNALESPAPAMVADAALLERAGCDAIVIPCNTSHVFYDEIQAAVSIPVVHLIELVADAAAARGMQTLCILCTEGTRASNLYGAACRSRGIRCRYPDPAVQEVVTSVIYDRVKAGKTASEQVLRSVIELELDAGCDGVVLGCTELSVAFQSLGLAARYPTVLDSLELLAQETVVRAGRCLRVSALCTGKYG